MSRKYAAYGLPWRGKMGIDVTKCMTSSDVIQSVTSLPILPSQGSP